MSLRTDSFRLAKRNNKLSHAFIFHGTSYDVMMEEAMAVSKVILGEDQLTESKVSSLNHPDLYRLVPTEDKINKEDIDDLLHQMNRKPTESENKVYIIGAFDKLSVYNQNRLLKFIEEPPNNTYAILVTTNLTNLLPTIQSRCQLIYFSEIDYTSISDQLKREDVPDKDIQILSRSIKTVHEGESVLAEGIDLKSLHQVVQKMTTQLFNRDLDVLLTLNEMYKISTKGLIVHYTLNVMHLIVSEQLKSEISIYGDEIFSTSYLQSLHHEKSTEIALLISDHIDEGRKKLASNVSGKLVLEQIIYQVVKGR